MGTLLQSPPNALSLADVAEISSQLAQELGHLVLKTEGFSVDDYLSLDGNYLVEYVDGCLQVLPMPDSLHQMIVHIITSLLLAYSKADVNARTRFSPFRVWLNDRLYREPDICFMKGENAGRRTNQYWRGADLVVEVISQSNKDHDYVTKRLDYAAAGIPEYWIIDPVEKSIRILLLIKGAYILHGEFTVGQIAASATLLGFAVDAGELFAQAQAQM